MQTFDQTTSGAQNIEWNVPGNYVAVITAANNVNVTLYKGGKKLDLGTITGIGAGLEVGPLPPHPDGSHAFDRVVVGTTAADTIKVGIGNGQARYNRASANVYVKSNMAPTASYGGSGILAIQPSTTEAQIFIANANRKALIIQNTDSAAIAYIGFGWVTDPTLFHIRLLPGETWEPAVVPTSDVRLVCSLSSANRTIKFLESS